MRTVFLVSILILTLQIGTACTPLYGRPTRANPTGIMDAQYNSRSRFYLETENFSHAQAIRIHVGQQQNAALRDNNQLALEDVEEALAVKDDDLPADFGLGNNVRRFWAIQKLNVHNLVRAAASLEAEENRRMQVLRNEAAQGLQALAAIASDQDALYTKDTTSPTRDDVADSSPRVKLEQINGDVSAHLFPAAPTEEEHESALSIGQDSSAEILPAASGLPLHGAATAMPSPNLYQAYSHVRTASDPTAPLAHVPQAQIRGRKRGRSFTASLTGSASLQPKQETKSLSGGHIDIDRQLASIPEALLGERGQHNSPAASRTDRPFWRNILSDSEMRFEGEAAQIYSDAGPYKRLSEVGTSLDGTMYHERRESAPLAPVVGDNSFRSVQSPPALNTWQHPQNALGPPPMPPPLHGPPVYYAVPSFAVPYVVYGPAPHQHHPQPPGSGPPPPPHGPPVFFGPPPPPQYGSQQQHFPWYRRQ